MAGSTESTEAERALARFEARHGREGRFRRYCRGRLRNLPLRLAVGLAGAAAATLLLAPGTGLAVAALVLAGEALDCGMLARLLRTGRTGDDGRRLALAGAAAQALGVALAVAAIWTAGPGGSAHDVALALLVGLAINAGLFLPLFPAAGLVRLGIFLSALVALELRGLLAAAPDAWRPLDIAASLMFAWLTGMFVAFVARADARRTADERTILTEGARLAASQRQLAETAAEARRLAAVARHANDSVILYAADGSVAWVNDTFTRITGYAAGEVIGRRIEEVMDLPEADPEVVARLTDARRRMVPCRAEVLNRRKSGELFWIETNLTPVPVSAGEAPMMLAVEREITGAKAREAELARARAEAEETARARARFLAVMSHEIRTPLTGVLGTAELLADTRLDPEPRMHVRTILESGRALLLLVNDILDLSRLEAGAASLAQEPFDFAATIDAAVALFGPTARAKGIALGWTPPNDLPPLLGDAGRIRQIALNLIGNAVKFTETGGVSVGLTWRIEGDAAALALGVADTGIGIAPDRLERIFDSFAQADAEIGRRFGGTGLGLSISRHLARQMGGDIVAQSAPGAGSVFTLTLRLPLAGAETTASAGAAACAALPRRLPGPAAPSDPASGPLSGRPCAGKADRGTATAPPGAAPPGDARAEPHGGAEAPGGEAHVLLADDNRTNARILAALLRRAGYRVDLAPDGAAAAAAAIRLRPDVVLMDLSMPVQDGYAALAAIRRAEAGTGRRTRVLALTADATAACREACRSAGFDGFLTKPVSRDALLAALSAEPAPDAAGRRGATGPADGGSPPEGPPPAAAPGRPQLQPSGDDAEACAPRSPAAVGRATAGQGAYRESGRAAPPGAGAAARAATTAAPAPRPAATAPGPPRAGAPPAPLPSASGAGQ